MVSPLTLASIMKIFVVEDFPFQKVGEKLDRAYFESLLLQKEGVYSI